MYKQLIIVRKDLPMSRGKICAQASHASLAFLSMLLREGEKQENNGKYEITVNIDKGIVNYSAIE